MTWRRNALLLVLFVTALAGIDRLGALARGGDLSTIACYVALANDLTPLIDAAASDTAAESPECNAQLQLFADRIREANVDRSTAGKAIVVG